MNEIIGCLRFPEFVLSLYLLFTFIIPILFRYNFARSCGGTKRDIFRYKNMIIKAIVSQYLTLLIITIVIVLYLANLSLYPVPFYLISLFSLFVIPLISHTTIKYSPFFGKEMYKKAYVFFIINTALATLAMILSLHS